MTTKDVTIKIKLRSDENSEINKALGPIIRFHGGNVDNSPSYYDQPEHLKLLRL